MVEVLSLRSLIAVADSGSVTAAAQLLKYTPSNITQHIRRLEREVREPLLERVGRGVVLTERARELVEKGRPVLLALDDLGAAPAGSEPDGTVRVAAFPTALRGLVIPAAASVSRRYPGLEVHPLEREPEEALRLVKAGLAEIAVMKTWGRVSGPTHRDGLSWIPVGIDRVDAILPASHPLAGRKAVTMTELAGERWAATPDDGPYRRWLATGGVFGAAGVPRLEAAEFQSLMEYAAQGLAVVAIPRMGRGPVPTGAVAVPLQPGDAFREVTVLARTAALDGMNVRAVIRALRWQAVTALESEDGDPEAGTVGPSSKS